MASPKENATQVLQNLSDKKDKVFLLVQKVINKHGYKLW